MRLIPFVRSHSTFRDMVDAYADAELAPPAAARFEAHMAACADCRASVEAARLLKSSLASLPEVAVPRSFRLTPAMVAAHHPAPAKVATPGFLVVARVAAAASVAAFAVVATLNLSSTGGSGGQTMSAGDSAASEATELKNAASQSLPDDDGDAPTQDTSLQPGVASPPGGGGVSGAGVDSPLAPPATGAEPTPEAQRNILAGGDTTGTPSAEEPPADAFSLAYDSTTGDGTSYTPWLAALGALAVAALGTLAFMEIQRRRP